MIQGQKGISVSKPTGKGGAMSRRLACAAVLAVFCSVFSLLPAHAKPLSPNSVTLKLGGYFPQHSDLDDFDSGANVGISLEHRVAPGFAVEGGLGYFKTKNDSAAEFEVVPLTLSLKGQTFFQQFEPYVDAGIGVYFIDRRLGAASDDDSQVGFHLGLGANYNVTPQLFLGLEGRYLWVKSEALGVDARLDGITLTGNVGFRF
jgi:opacity protein-like surface antigen